MCCALVTCAAMNWCWSTFDTLRLRTDTIKSVLVDSGVDCVRGSALLAESSGGLWMPGSKSACMSCLETVLGGEKEEKEEYGEDMEAMALVGAGITSGGAKRSGRADLLLEESPFEKKYWRGERMDSRREDGSDGMEGESECVDCFLSDRRSAFDFLGVLLGEDTVR